MAAGSDRQITIDLLARDHTERAADSAKDNLNEVADSADKVTKSTKGMSAEMERGKARIAGLDKEIGSIRASLGRLHEGFGDVTDAVQRMDIEKGIRIQERKLAQLTKRRNFLANMLPDPEPAGRSFAARLAGGIGSGLSGISAKLGSAVGPTVGAAIGAAAAPVLLGTISTALAAGAGAGVGLGGVALAIAADPKLQQAGAAAGARFSQGLQEAARRALSGRVGGILADLEAAGGRLTQKLGTAFSKIGPFIRPFIKDVTAAAEAIGGKLLTVAGNSGPALQGLGQSIRLIGDGVRDFVGMVADGGPEAASNLRLIAGALGDMLRQTGFMIKSFNELANNPWITGPLIPLLRKHYDEVAAKQKQVADSAPQAADGIENIGSVAEEATPPLRTAADALRDIANANKDLFDSAGDVEEAMDKVTLSIRENGQTISIHTVKGRANRDALSDLATQMNRNYDATLKVNGEGPKTDQVARSNTRNFVALATQMTGSRKKALELANQLLSIPDVRRTVTIRGLDAAKSVVRRIKDTLNSIKDKNVHINYITSTGKSSSELRAAYNKNAREYGGPVKAGHAYVVGEKRAEVFVPDRDGRIVPSLEKFARMGGQAMSPGGGAWRPYSGGAMSIRIITAGGGEGKLAELINYLFRNGMIAAVPG